MARERYLLHAGEETIHSDEIVLKTRGEKFKNWWHYSYRAVIALALVTALVAAFVVTMVTKTKSDYQVLLITEDPYPADLVNKLQQVLQSVCDDRNGDGKVVVSLYNYDLCLPQDFTSDEYDTYEAYLTRYAVDVSDGESMIYFYDEASFRAMYEDQLLCYTDGSVPASKATDYENMRCGWYDCALIKDIGTDIEISELFSATYSDEYVHSILSKLYVSFRTTVDGAWAKKQEGIDYYNDSWALFNKIRFGAGYTCAPLASLPEESN